MRRALTPFFGLIRSIVNLLIALLIWLSLIIIKLLKIEFAAGLELERPSECANFLAADVSPWVEDKW